MPVRIVGGGLAGTEAAWQAAARGVAVTLYEMRPVRPTAVHKTGQLAELDDEFLDVTGRADVDIPGGVVLVRDVLTALIEGRHRVLSIFACSAVSRIDSNPPSDSA